MRVPRVASILVFWLGALAVSISTYTIINDHFDRISRARQIARYGALPFRDFFDPGYFMTELSSAGLQLLFGDNLLGEMLLNTVFIASGAALVFALARRISGSYLGGLVAALLTLFAMPRAYDFDKVLFYPLGIFLCWRYVDRPGLRRALELAAGIAIGALFRYDTGVYTGLAAVVTMLVLHWREPKVCAQRITVCGLTVALCGLAVLLPVVGFGGVGDAIDQVVTYAVREEARTEVVRAPRFSIGDFIGRASMSSPVTHARQSLTEEPLWIHAEQRFPPLQLRVFPDAWTTGNATAFLYYFFWGLPFVTVIAMAIAWQAPWNTAQELARLGGIVAVCLALNLFVLREPIGARIGGIGGPTAILATWVAARAWQVKRVRLRLALSAIVFTTFALAVCSLGWLASWSERFVPALIVLMRMHEVSSGK